MKLNLYKFKNIEAVAPSKEVAFEMIANKSVEIKQQVPSINEIQFVRPLTDDEIKNKKLKP